MHCAPGTLFNPTPDCDHNIEDNSACEPTCDWPRNVDCGDRGGISTTSTTTTTQGTSQDETTTQGSTEAEHETTTTTTERPSQEGM